jgi:hypothetical protein
VSSVREGVQEENNKQLSCCDGDVEGKRRDDRPLDNGEIAALARISGKEIVNTEERGMLQLCRATKGRRGAWWGRRVKRW